VAKWNVFGFLLLAVVIVVGLRQHWGAAEWGTASLTLAAVVVALRQANIAHRESLSTEHSRAVEHEVNRRRENLKALADLWTAILVMNTPVIAFRVYFQNLRPVFDPNKPRTDVDPDATDQPLAFEITAQYEKFTALWLETIEPPLFVVLALLKGTPVENAVMELSMKLRDVINTKVPALSEPIKHGRRPDAQAQALKDAWLDITGRRQEHLDLARLHFSLTLSDVEESLHRT
jgi:hypothetical protein